MSSKLQNERLNYSPLNSRQLANLCGAYHENIKLIELFFNINIKVDHDEVVLFGYSQPGLVRAKQVIKQLHKLADRPIQAETVNSFLANKDPKKVMSQSIKMSRKTILPRNHKQADYLDSINKHDITFAVGPAGTGKTYLAVSKAIEAFEKGEVQRLVLVRPAVEAGEKLGFLPGDLVEKVLPYLRPIYDALYEMIGFKETQKLIQSDVIEVLPLAFMRGRTLNEAFIILDEAQNTTIPQMKMFLTRMGFGSKTVITGDVTQIDLPKGTESGLLHAAKLLAHIPEISIHYFSSREVVRHPLVSRIIDSYDDI
ncbi:PhoH family protein [Legionella jordanis]|uniref:PhoH-like protein n=1 Tax=Legionella jordanis TaxID=456 RepID=A0A0W0VAG0_9GAMM|nr:PhoH family protein [Legionella jordanis]KTD17090.1 phosphate starvation-inducible protein PhoH [Legionella jordanis]VEH12713.1 phosphate starvation-inducible protein PhoH [Legionella jordanis]